MKGWVKNQLVQLLACPPVLRFVQVMGFRQNAISIFTYHALIDTPLDCPDWCFLDVNEFERQIAYLAKNFDIVSISQAVEMLAEGTVTKPCAVITFDDGFQSQIDQALPILEKYQAPAIIYLTSDLINSHECTWFSRIIRALSATQKTVLSWGGVNYPITSREDKAFCNQSLQNELKQLHQQDLMQKVEGIERLLDTPVNPPTPKDSPFRMIDSDTIARTKDHPLIEYGAHTQSHAILSLLSDDEKYDEIKASIRDVESFTGTVCEHFAYPNGRDIDFDEHCKHVLNKYHIQSAVTMTPGPAIAPMEDNYHIPRYPIGSDTSFSRFVLMAHHIF